jgi:glycosyltransferase involved in cell wall biosynthesis
MITILTPAYNRGATLPRLYDSLCQQTELNFEWIVIDDGSTDNTSKIISKYKENSIFKIIYFYQENGGKHRAINSAITRAYGDWLFIVDSDDILTRDAVSRLYQCIDSLDSEFVGACFRKATLSGEVMGISGTNLKASMVISPTLAGYIFKGELAYFFRTHVMRNCPFPEFENEKFVPELYIWNKISDVGKIIFYTDKIIYLCEYLPDGYTNNFKFFFKSNPRGFGLFYRDQIIRDTRLFGKVKACIRSMQCILNSFLRN